jgi:hypothetical protein
MNIRRLGVGLILLSGWALHAQSAGDNKLIEKVKQQSVSSLDGTLPGEPLEKFIATQGGAGADLYWEVNDCAPLPGTKKQKDLVCVEVQAQLPDQRGFVVRIKVGSSKKAASETPEFYSADLITPGQTLQLKHLGELAPALAKTNRSQNAQQ